MLERTLRGSEDSEGEGGQGYNARRARRSPRFPSPAVDREPDGIARRRTLPHAATRRRSPAPSSCPVGLDLSHS